MKKIKIALIANTGLGNQVLKKLIFDDRVIVDSVCTRKLEGYFPYYNETELAEYAKTNNITCFTDIKASTEYYSFLKNREVDLIFVASFHQILKREIIELPKIGIINFHPSLLPKYRGPSPLNWLILNRESKTGVTAHFLIEKIDAGNIIANNSFGIEPNETLGSLFEKSALYAGELVNNVIEIFESNSDYKGRIQNEFLATYMKKPSNEDRMIDSSNMSFEKAYSILRAFHPYPGALIDQTTKKMRVIDFSLKAIEGYKKFMFGSRNIYLSLEEIN